jgi:4-hydroxybenzoate polyprenyltransferase
MNADPQVPRSTASFDEPRPADALPSSWVDSMPAAARPYLRLMRLDRPIGVWLLFWPCMFGLVLGAFREEHLFPNPLYIALFALGAIVMRGAGCTYNDIVDREFDAKVARTRNRPIPSGAVSVKAAWIFTGVQAAVGLAILLAFNLLTIALGAASLLLIAAYPFMKRITWWPQAWLGLTFNWGVLMGFAAETSHLGKAAYLYYVGCFFWTLGYDTIYAHQDKEDDILIGVKSTALKLGKHTLRWLYIFYGLAFLCWLAGGLFAELKFVYAIALLVPGAHLLWQLHALDTSKPLLCLKLFKSNRDTGFLVSTALVLGVIAGF